MCIRDRYQVAGRLTRTARSRAWSALHIREDGALASCVKALVTFALVTFAWIFFGAPSLERAFDVLRQIPSGFTLSVQTAKNAAAMLGFNAHTTLRMGLAKMCIRDRFRHIRDNQIFYRTYFKLGYDNRCRIVAYDEERARREFGGRFVEYHMEFFKSGLTSIIKLWLQNGCRETPDELFEVIRSEYRGRGICPPGSGE